MRNLKRNILIVGIGLLFIGLFSAYTFMWKETQLEYLDRIDNEEGSFVQNKEFKNFDLSMSYHPPKYLALEQIVKSKDDKKWSENELIEEYSSFSNYKLKFSNANGGGILKEIANSATNYQELVSYLSFGIQEDLTLQTPTDTIIASFTHFERNFDVAPFANIEIGFKVDNLANPLLEEKFWVVEYNADRFGLGPLKFRFEAEEVVE